MARSWTCKGRDDYVWGYPPNNGVDQVEKIVVAALFPLALTGCVQPTAGDMLVAAQTCQAAGISPQLPMHAACVDKLVEDNEDRYAQIGIVTAVASLGLGVASFFFSAGALSSY